MALSRFVVTNTVTVAAGAAAANGTNGSAATPGSAWSELWGVTFVRGQAIMADSSAGSNGAQLLYQAIGAGNLRAFVQGQDDVGHAALAN
jgi:hypothetical protein